MQMHTPPPHSQQTRGNLLKQSRAPLTSFISLAFLLDSPNYSFEPPPLWFLLFPFPPLKERGKTCNAWEWIFIPRINHEHKPSFVLVTSLLSCIKSTLFQLAGMGKGLVQLVCFPSLLLETHVWVDSCQWGVEQGITLRNLFEIATLSEHGLHWDSPRLLPLLAHQHPQEYIPAAPVTQCPPVTMLNWGTLTQMVLHTSTSSQVRFFTEMPRAKLSHPSSWHAGSHKLWSHTPCCSSKDHQ